MIFFGKLLIDKLINSMKTVITGINSIKVAQTWAFLNGQPPRFWFLVCFWKHKEILTGIFQWLMEGIVCSRWMTYTNWQDFCWEDPRHGSFSQLSVAGKWGEIVDAVGFFWALIKSSYQTVNQIAANKWQMSWTSYSGHFLSD